MSKVLYGPADIKRLSITHTNGDVHELDFSKGRHPSPGYGDESRSLPVADADKCAKCSEWLLSQGFSPRAEKVSATSDENAWEDDANTKGNVYAKLMASQFGEQLARLATDSEKAKRTSNR